MGKIFSKKVNSLLILKMPKDPKRAMKQITFKLWPKRRWDCWWNIWDQFYWWWSKANFKTTSSWHHWKLWRFWKPNQIQTLEHQIIYKMYQSKAKITENIFKTTSATKSYKKSTLLWRVVLKIMLLQGPMITYYLQMNMIVPWRPSVMVLRNYQIIKGRRKRT